MNTSNRVGYGRDEFLQEIGEVNIAYLQPGAATGARNPMEAMLKLGVSKEVASILISLTSTEDLSKLATSDMVLCRFRFDDHAILSNLTAAIKNREMQIQRTTLQAQSSVESLG
ncbi:transcriptional activator FlhD (plasmid) [Cupriavidus necator N-1]|uniref:Transcriptional activator FlhD n=1 Tax=Cupriavidus necator (strain ATCC 43291 / DSM 13513 / CCUG 52238 / LMG 8453 / N-1) TaxID=1042878 RepID=F8GU86_CUPNN|nr:flagellar transcriptional regulator FlhD [Cupriavidus necator]AEI82290.1 transcriptional activator FlhD [Cupriavidus necator N-1]MDX6007308.1 flagellar transcriptional regulator FlhD [Cupriavidus necator]